RYRYILSRQPSFEQFMYINGAGSFKAAFVGALDDFAHFAVSERRMEIRVVLVEQVECAFLLSPSAVASECQRVHDVVPPNLAIAPFDVTRGEQRLEPLGVSRIARIVVRRHDK